jgi:hypothetical protein
MFVVSSYHVLRLVTSMVKMDGVVAKKTWQKNCPLSSALSLLATMKDATTTYNCHVCYEYGRKECSGYIV